MTTYYIQRVRKDDNDNIIAVKTTHGEFTTTQVVSMIKANHMFFVKDSNGPRVGIYRERFIRSYANNEWDDNLDNLPSF